MDYHDRHTRRASAGVRNSLVIVFIVTEIAAVLIRPAASHHPYPALNTPPILYVPDRNWRIPETEQIGQIIARIRAEDAENDELVFGLEPHFHSNYANPNDNGIQDNSRLASDSLPFRIDSAGGIVYLNESLIGRAGENFFLYITVSDGQLTAKNEVFVNILGSNGKKFNSRKPPSITNVVHNISQFLPAFHQLPGVQSVRNQQLYNLPSNNVPNSFAMNPSFFSPHRPVSGNEGGGGDGNGYHVLNINPNQQGAVWPTNYSDSNENNENYSEANVKDSTESSPLETSLQTSSTIRTKLTPIRTKSQSKDNASENIERKNSTVKTVRVADRPTGADPEDIPSIHSTTAYSIKAATIPVIITVCGLFAAAVVVFGYLFRKRLCAISKTLKKKSKEEMAKKSNQSIISCNLQDDSRNSMVMQHWNGPVAYGNRYVPWERDQQQSAATPQISTGVVNGTNYVSSAVALSGISGSNVGGTGLPVVGGGGPSSNSNVQNKYDRWEFPRHRLKFFNILGEGAFGQVWRCEATDIDGFEGVTTVAVKTLKENATEVEKHDLVSELQVMKSLEPHVNVVRLLGCCTDKDPLFVVIEYVNRGKLQTYLRNSRAERHYGNTHGKSNILTSSDLTSFMYQVGKGMDYLTSRGIIHRDLAARNVLITDDHICKVADFGFARDVVTSKIYERKSEGKLPIRWMAIESLYDNIFSVKSDIWSFGILMWEIVTLGSTPYPGISAADVMHKVRDGYRLEKPEHCRRELYNIMYYCWSENVNERPTFSEVVQMLDKLLHTEMDYIELERFPDHNYYNILNLSGEKL